MKGKTTLVGILVLFGIFLGVVPTKASAASCSDFNFSVTNPPPTNISCGNEPTPFTVTVRSGSGLFITGETYTLNSGTAPQQVVGLVEVSSAVASNPNSITFTVTNIQANPGTRYWHKIKGNSVGAANGGCEVYDFSVSRDSLTGSVYISQNRGGQTCYGFPSGCTESGTNGEILVENVQRCGVPYANESLRVKVTGPGRNFSEVSRTDGNGSLPAISFPISEIGVHEILVEKTQGINTNVLRRNFTVVGPGSCSSCTTTKPTYSTATDYQDYKICDQVSGSLITPEGANAKDRCIACIGGDELGRAGIWTAVGCIPREPEKIVNSLLRLGLGMGGGFALIIILASGFVLSTSQGEPKRIEDAKQWLTSALVGMLFIIFSVTLLHFIGYSIFKIPGFGGP